MRWRTTVTDDPDDKTQGRFGLMSEGRPWFAAELAHQGMTLVSSARSPGKPIGQ